jgi:rhamnogalacturonyl hydrolase YesR
MAASIWMVVLPVWGQQQTPADSPDLFSREHILSTMEKVADWQLDHLVSEAPLPGGDTERVTDTSWIRGALFTGVMATFKATGKQKYLDAARGLGERNDWQPGPRPRHADDHCIAQTYAELYLLERDERMIEPIRSRFDLMIAKPKLGSEVGWSKKRNWSWCDALFMAPPAMALLGEATGDRKYLDLMNTLWWETYDYLFDRQEQLWYRDGSFVIREDGSGPRTSNGEKIFWGRGNGWVLAGLARVLEHMPDDYPHRPRYEELMRQMAARLIGRGVPGRGDQQQRVLRLWPGLGYQQRRPGCQDLSARGKAGLAGTQSDPAPLRPARLGATDRGRSPVCHRGRHHGIRNRGVLACRQRDPRGLRGGEHRGRRGPLGRIYPIQ